MKNLFSLPLTLIVFAIHSTALAADYDRYIPNWNKYIPGNNGDDSNVHYGPTRISNETEKELTIFGPAEIDNSNITKLATLKGPVRASHSSFKSIHIDGVANFDNVKVIKDLYINGPVIARDSSFDVISIATSEMTLSNCTVTKLIVRKNDNTEPQRVYLDKGTKIESIVFEKNGGRVILGDSSVVVNHLEGGEQTTL